MKIIGFLLSLFVIMTHGHDAFGKCFSRNASVEPISLNGLRGIPAEKEFLRHIKKSELQRRLPVRLGRARNGVDLFRVEYTSIDIKGQPVLVSGLMMVPDDCSDDQPVIVLQHGTIVEDMMAPSVTAREGLAEAALGFLVLVPDYLGFGSSKDYLHPYVIAQPYQQNGIDMIRAGKRLMKQEDVEPGALFVQGYSEGGYAAMALQKAITKLGDEDIKLTAASYGAGPYDLLATGYNLVKAEETNPLYLTYVLVSYAEYFDDLPSLKAMLINPKEWQLPDAFDGTQSYDEIIGRMPTAVDKLVTPNFRSGFIRRIEELYKGNTVKLEPFENYLIANSVHIGWVPQVPTRLVHCVDDKVVPVASGDRAYEALSAVSDLVSYERIESIPGRKPYTHTTCPGYFSPVRWFMNMLEK